MEIYTTAKYSYFLNEFFAIFYTSLNLMAVASDINMELRN